jgi:hypothetical protein
MVQGAPQRKNAATSISMWPRSFSATYIQLFALLTCSRYLAAGAGEVAGAGLLAGAAGATGAASFFIAFLCFFT